MMKEQGIVTKIINHELAEVGLRKGADCGQCGVCREGAEGTMIAEVRNPLQAKVGQIVELEFPTQQLVKSSLVVFLLPILLMIVGYLLGNKMFGETGGIIGSLVLLFISFFVSKWYDQNIEKREQSRGKITRIL